MEPLKFVFTTAPGLKSELVLFQNDIPGTLKKIKGTWESLYEFTNIMVRPIYGDAEITFQQLGEWMQFQP